ncbi:akirin-2-like [Oscarella lobularis]|uniref:akirin-2-like n=1 Tax=Oscarella lobularis TaxID=121494 RepID=UPI0033136956
MACATLKRSFHEANAFEPSPKRRRCTSGSILSQTASPDIMAQSQCSTFAQATTPTRPDELTSSIRSEWKRLARRRKILESDEIDESPSGAPVDESRTKEPAIFTLKQVKMIIERLWKEREQHIREEYEKVLSEKLAEQYESFVKFSQDHLQKKFSGDSISYVS